MFETKSAEKVATETPKKPFVVCGFLGVFWNICSGVKLPVKLPSEGKVPPEAPKKPFCDRHTCTSAAASAAEKKVLIEKFEHLVVEGSKGASRKIHYGPEDHLGSTRMVLNEAGAIQQALMYQPYGTVSNVDEMGAISTDPLRQKFTTKELDEEGVIPDDQRMALGIVIAMPGNGYSGSYTMKLNTVAEPFELPLYNHVNASSDPTLQAFTSLSVGGTDYYEYIEIKIRNTATSESYTYRLDGINWTGESGYLKTYTLDGTLSEIVVAISTSDDLFIESRTTLGNSRMNLSYFGARYLDSDLGIWISGDPKEQFYNPYSYSSNPINTVDPNGQWVQAVMAAASWYIGGVMSNNGQMNPGKWDWSDPSLWMNTATAALGMGMDIGMDFKNIAYMRSNAGKYERSLRSVGAVAEVSETHVYVDQNDNITKMDYKPNSDYHVYVHKNGAVVSKGLEPPQNSFFYSMTNGKYNVVGKFKWAGDYSSEIAWRTQYADAIKGGWSWNTNGFNDFKVTHPSEVGMAWGHIMTSRDVGNAMWSSHVARHYSGFPYFFNEDKLHVLSNSLTRTGVEDPPSWGMQQWGFQNRPTF